MLAAIYKGPKNIAVEEIPKPVPGPADVVVKIKNASICGTDLTAYLINGAYVSIHEGDRFGHEFVGVVDEVGAQVPPEIKPGLRVFVNPSTAKRGGMVACNTCGAFAEYVLVEDASVGYNLYPLADGLSFDRAVLTEPYSVSVHGAATGAPEAGKRAVVFGAGPIGLGVISGLKAMGVEDIVASDIMEERLKAAARLGAATVDPSKEDLGDFLRAHFGGVKGQEGPEKADCEIYVDCAGIPGVMADFCRYGMDKARLVVVAVHKRPAEISMVSVLSQNLEIMGSCAYGDVDIRRALQFLEDSKNQFPEIVTTHHFKFDQIHEAFETAADPKRALKVVIDFD